jgi:hypothetical protein
MMFRVIDGVSYNQDEEIPIEQRICAWLEDEHEFAFALSNGRNLNDPTDAYFTGQAHAYRVAILLIRLAFAQDKENQR